MWKAYELAGVVGALFQNTSRVIVPVALTLLYTAQARQG